jgi:hypothetical protein
MARTTPDWSPKSEEDYEIARRELKKRFARWRASVGVAPDKDAGEAAIHYKWAYLDGHLTRWTCADLDEIYLELYPAKVMVEDDELTDVLNEAKFFISFLDGTGLLDTESDPADVLIDHLVTVEMEFRHNMADTSRYSFGKRVWMRAHWPKESTSTIGHRSRPSWPTSTLGRSPNATPSWVRVSHRDPQSPAGSPHRGRGPSLHHPSVASAGTETQSRPGSGGQST